MNFRLAAHRLLYGVRLLFSVGIPGRFRGNAGFSVKFVVWGGSGNLGPQKVFAQIAMCPISNRRMVYVAPLLSWQEIAHRGFVSQVYRTPAIPQPTFSQNPPRELETPIPRIGNPTPGIGALPHELETPPLRNPDPRIGKPAHN